MNKNIARNLAIWFFASFTVICLWLNFVYKSAVLPEGLLLLGFPDVEPKLLFGATYGLLALFGGVYGLVTARRWGFHKSALGRTILYLAMGLLFAEFGQLVFSYYNIVKGVEIPYPSLADVGFFGNIPLYILAALSLSKVTAVKASIKRSPWKLLLGIFVPLIILVVSYSQFLKGYDPTEVPLLTKVLDFGYPLGQAVYVSIALVILLCVGRLLGGVFKKPLFILLGAFVLQYAADFNFLYQTVHETWINGGYGDYLYLSAYFAMTMSLVSLNAAFMKLQGGKETPQQPPESTARTE